MTDGGDGDGPAWLLAEAMDELLRVAPDDLPVALSSLASRFGIAQITLYLADLQQVVLAPWGPTDREAENIEGTQAGLAFRRGEPVATTKVSGGYRSATAVTGSGSSGCRRPSSPRTGSCMKEGCWRPWWDCSSPLGDSAATV